MDVPEPAAAAWTYDRAIEALEALARHPIDATPPRSAERMRRLLALRGSPQAGLRIAVVAGTVGKGSTATMLAAVLQAAGMRVGLFTGPHLCRYTERFQVDGREIGDDDLASRLQDALGLAEALVAEGDSRLRPSVIELLALVALEVFRDAGCAWAIMEAGVGGFRDYTGALEPGICVLTEVDLDHTHLLGTTVEAIAREKAGIVRPGIPLVATCTHPDARAVIVARCAEAAAPLYLLGRDFEGRSGSPDAPGTALDFSWPVRGIRMPGLRVGLRGAHQVSNAAGAVAAALAIHEGSGLGAGEGADLEAIVRTALAGVRFPGRLEIVPGDPPVLLDGAHQPAGARALRAALAATHPGTPVHLVLGVLSDKDRDGVASALAPAASAVTVTAPPWASRAGDLRTLRDAVLRHARPGVDVRLEPDCAAALEAACDRARREGALVCVAGSLYLVGAVREMLARREGDGVPEREKS